MLLSPLPGTRIIYERKFLMECRNSPVAKTPPSHLPDIPGVTSPSLEELKLENHHVQSCGEEKVSTGKCWDSKPLQQPGMEVPGNSRAGEPQEPWWVLQSFLGKPEWARCHWVTRSLQLFDPAVGPSDVALAVMGCNLI